MTVDQAGSGSAGTFTITVDMSGNDADTANGSLAGTVTATGSAANQFVIHHIISGTYASGAFTVTSESYSETRSYSVTQSTITTDTSGEFQMTTRLDTVYVGTSTLTWTAALDTDGQLTYTAYDFVANQTGHEHTVLDPQGGIYYEFTTDTAYSVHTVGVGMTASYTGTDTTNSTYYTRYVAPDGTVYESSGGDQTGGPISGSTMLPMDFALTTDWTWNAGTTTATNYTFHGVGTDDSTLTESATITETGTGTTLDVTAFNSTSHAFDSSHVVDDEPETTASGTASFHRDELYTSTDDGTGSGSYISGSANADYHAVETGTYAVANAYTVSNDYSTGIDEDGDAYSLNFNYVSTRSGSGTTTGTYDFHDTAQGMTLTGETLGITGSTTDVTHTWGTRNGVAFNDPVEAHTETVNDSKTFPGSSGVVIANTRLTNAPFRSSTIPRNARYNGPLPKVVAGGTLAAAAAWYAVKLSGIGDNAVAKVGKGTVQKEIVSELNAQLNANAAGALATSTFTISPDANTPGGRGGAFAEAIPGMNKLWNDADKRARDQMEEQGKEDVTLAYTKVVITYAVDEANKNPRSGNVVAEITIQFFYDGKNKNGTPFTGLGKAAISANVLINDDNVKTIKLR